MRIVALITPARAALIARVGAQHEVLVGSEALEAQHLAGEPGTDVLLLDAAAPGARDVAVRLRADPDLLTMGVVVLLEEPTQAAEWAPVTDDVLVASTADAEVLVRLRTAGRLAGLRGELHARTQALEQLAYNDVLTGLPNRRYLEGRLDALLSAARRHDRRLTVLLADLDHFKNVNDRLGHEAGDRLLTAAADGMRRRLRAEDELGRWAGDEFVVLLPETSGPAARASAERLRVAVSRELRAHVPGLPVGLSVGIATWDGEEDAARLLRRVDQALYDAKRAGRDRVALAGGV